VLTDVRDGPTRAVLSAVSSARPSDPRKPDARVRAYRHQA